MNASPEARIRRGVKVILVVIVALLAFVLGGALLPPSWWSPVYVQDERPLQRASDFEQLVTARVHEIRDSEDPWGFRVSQDQVNEWLATRLPMWIEHDEKLQWPSGINQVQVRFGDGQIEVAGRGGGPVWRARFGVSVSGSTCQLEPQSAGVGRIPVFGMGLDGLVEMVPEGVLNDQGVIEMPTEMTLVDGRRVRLVDFELIHGELAVLLETLPPGDSGQEDPDQPSSGDDPLHDGEG